MKTPIPFRQSLALAAIAIFLSAMPPAVDAQEKPRPTSRAQATRSDAGASPYVLTIEDGLFLHKGQRSEATLSQIVDALREMFPEVNLALAPELAKTRIADLKLRATAVEEALEALRVASGNRFIWTKPGATAGVDPATGLPLPLPREGSLYSLQPNEPGGGGGMAGRSVEVFNLGTFLQGESDAKAGIQQIEEIKKIIFETLAQLKGADRWTTEDAPGFQFHSGANLLIVIGGHDALEVARKVVSALVAQGGGGGRGGGGFGYSDPFAANAFGSSKARQNIISKLESTRLDSVLYDSLPLGEVVRHLIDEAKKRDPEKKGINILINPNEPAAPASPRVVDPSTGLSVPAPSAPPSEAVDISSISIKINPPLTNVRLLDVLDAIVRVADHPIRYSITDYAVVFSLGGPEGPMSGAPWPGAPPGSATIR